MRRKVQLILLIVLNSGLIWASAGECLKIYDRNGQSSRIQARKSASNDMKSWTAGYSELLNIFLGSGSQTQKIDNFTFSLSGANEPTDPKAFALVIWEEKLGTLGAKAP
jgi:hypothetical protein